MGQNEGTQIIQLFGRGVRLRGYGMSLRRSKVLAYKPKPPQNMQLVETLHVFGVKADYMRRFRDWILEEVPEALEKETWDLPVLQTLPQRKLKTLRLKAEIEGEKVERGQAFRRLGPLVRLRPPDPMSPADRWLLKNKTRLNWLPRIRGIAGEDKRITAAVGEATELPLQRFTPIHIALLDIDELLFELEAFKATRSLDRLHADRAAILALLERHEWYELSATNDDMRTDRYENRMQWQRMAQQLINSYAERFYRYMRSRWEAPYLEVAEIDQTDFMPQNFSIETTDRVQTIEEIEQIGEFVVKLRDALAKNPLAPWTALNGSWRTVPFEGHLYQPLLYVGKNAQIKISPVPLDKHEAKFVEDLAKWCTANADQEVYLLRNQAVTGLGFFQAGNFFPDFLLWVQDNDRQHLAFVDPKGLHHFDPADAKIQFATQEIPKLQEIIAKQSPELMLHSFILSNTLFADLQWSTGDFQGLAKAQIEELGVLFQADDPDAYIASMMQRILQPAVTT